MLKKNRSCIRLLFVGCCLALSISSSYSQQKIIDSLNIVLKNQKSNGVDNLQTMLQLTKCYINEEKEEAYKLCDETLVLAKNQENIELKLQAYVNKALILETQDSIEYSYYMIDTCFHYINKLESTAVKAESLLSIANIKHKYKDDADILSMLFEALDVAKEINDKKLQIKIFYFLTNIYYRTLDDLENIQKYAELAGQVAEGIADVQEKGLSYISKGFMYRMKFTKNREHDAYLDSAIVYFNKSISLYEAMDGYIPLNTHLSPVGHLISTYTYKTFVRNDSTFYIYPDSIYKYSHIMLDRAIEENNSYYIATAYDFLSGYESNRKEFQNAEDMLYKALDFLKDNETHLQKKHSIILSLVYQLQITKKYEQALDYMEEAYLQQGKIFKKEYIRNGQIAEAKYRLKENEKQLLLSRKEANQRRQLFIGSIIIAIILIVFLFIFSQMRLKNSKQQNKLLEKEKEEIRLHALVNEMELEQSESQRKTLALEKELEKEKSERQAIEINQLQKELIVGTVQLDQKNETIEKIKQVLNESKQFNNHVIKDLLLTDKMADKSFDDFSTLFQNVHPEFYSKLQEKANQKLTVLDLKYCIYIFMNFSSKEIANITHVNFNTVRTTKYRLKLKLNLSKDEDLAAYIKNVIERNNRNENKT